MHGMFNQAWALISWRLMLGEGGQIREVIET